MFKKQLLLFAFCGFAISSCEKEPEVNCIISNAVVTTNSPVLSGSEIILKASDMGNVNYNWTGPNGFVSNLRNPILINSSISMSGEYKLITSKGICKSGEILTNVVVINNTVNCTPVDNTVVIGGNNINLNNNTQVADVNNEYRVLGSSGLQGLTVYFLGNNKPLSGIYSLVPNNTILSNSTARMSYTDSSFGTTSNFYTKTGDVSLTYTIDGKAIIKFCSIPFYFGTNTNSVFVSSGKFTVN